MQLFHKRVIFCFRGKYKYFPRGNFEISAEILGRLSLLRVGPVYLGLSRFDCFQYEPITPLLFGGIYRRERWKTVGEKLSKKLAI